MPTPAQIVDWARSVSQRGVLLAALWHVVLAAALVALARGWRPSPPSVDRRVALALASVAAVALSTGNPFNGLVFAAAALALVALPSNERRRAHVRPGRWMRAVAGALLAFGWAYPHFLDRPLLYLVAAPVGVVPCPTLSVALGFSAIAGGLSSRSRTLGLCALGALYGAFGAFVLGVRIDLVLLAGALALAAASLRREHAGSRSRATSRNGYTRPASRSAPA